jgi:hypothetical protein
MNERDTTGLVNVDLLPPNLRRLCRVLGERKAFALCKQRGGVPLRVPQRASLEHWLVELLGFDGLQALVDAFGGEYVDVPKYDKVAMQLQHQQVHACLMAGMGPTRTALKTGYTKRHVCNIQQDLQEAMGDRYSPNQAPGQQDLFAELLLPCSPADDEHDFEALEEAAAAEQDRAHRDLVKDIDEEHREVALSMAQGAHDPFGMGRRER